VHMTRRFPIYGSFTANPPDLVSMRGNPDEVEQLGLARRAREVGGWFTSRRSEEGRIRAALF
jgi:hypothetical protein